MVLSSIPVVVFVWTISCDLWTWCKLWALCAIQSLWHTCDHWTYQQQSHLWAQRWALIWAQWKCSILNIYLCVRACIRFSIYCCEKSKKCILYAVHRENKNNIATGKIGTPLVWLRPSREKILRNVANAFTYLYANSEKINTPCIDSSCTAARTNSYGSSSYDLKELLCISSRFSP